MNIITFFNSLYYFLIHRFEMIGKIHNITILSADSWVNILVHGLIAVMELVLIYWIIKFLLNTLHLGTYTLKFFALLGIAFTRLFQRPTPTQISPEKLAQLNSLLDKLSSQQKRY